jgi:hypothetical protein
VSFDVTIDGLQSLLDALRDWPELVAPELERASDAALLSLIPDLADYPEPPAGSTYRRSGNLGRLWTTARPEFAQLSTGFEASIGNARPGAEFVEGERQAEVHQGRWPTTEQVIRDHTVEIEHYFDNALQKVAEKLGRS